MTVRFIRLGLGAGLCASFIAAADGFAPPR